MNVTEKIAEAAGCNPECSVSDCLTCGWAARSAEAVVAAIRAMTPTEQAELIGGQVDERTRGMYGPVTGLRVVTPWREVTR